MRRGAVIFLSACVFITSACGGNHEKAGAFQPHFDRRNFHGTSVDNRWYPLEPGTRFVYRGTKDNRRARDVVTVTARTKEILGVRCTVVHDRLFLSGEPAEDTFDWYAQDSGGNVWYFGEATKELEHGRATSTEGSWQAGVNGARPGVIMQARPRVGDAYAQEHYAGHAEDHAQVLSLSGTAGRYSDVQVTKEWTPLEPGVVDRKYYARGVGLVKEETAKGPRESLTLVRVSRP